MKKSSVYYMAQLAVIESNIDTVCKLEILKRLLADEELARYCERQAEKEADVV